MSKLANSAIILSIAFAGMFYPSFLGTKSTYFLPADQVIERLTNPAYAKARHSSSTKSGIEIELSGLDPAVPPVFTVSNMSVKVTAADPSHIEWLISDGGSLPLHLTAFLKSTADNSTESRLEITLPVENPNHLNGLQRIAIKNLFEVAFKEQFDSIIAGRKYQPIRTYPQFAGALLVTFTQLFSK